MKPPLSIRPLEAGEHQQLEDTLHTTEAFRLRRAQYLLASHRGHIPRQIAKTYGGCEQNVRNIIRAFNAQGLECLTPRSRRPRTTTPLLEGKQLERLQHILHQSPRPFGKHQSTWTQNLLAEVACEDGVTKQQVCDETIRRALSRLNTNWKRAKHWITSPDPQYALKKSGENA